MDKYSIMAVELSQRLMNVNIEFSFSSIYPFDKVREMRRLECLKQFLWQVLELFPSK